MTRGVQIKASIITESKDLHDVAGNQELERHRTLEEDEQHMDVARALFSTLSEQLAVALLSTAYQDEKEYLVCFELEYWQMNEDAPRCQGINVSFSANEYIPTRGSSDQIKAVIKDVVEEILKTFPSIGRSGEEV